MAKSMTGFGRAQQTLHGRVYTAEVKSVNSRYFEYSSKLPRSMGFLDDALKKAVSAEISRGKAEVYLSVQNIDGAEISISANLPVARGYFEALAAIAHDLRLEQDVKASHYARLPDVFNLQKSEMDEDELAADALSVVKMALERFAAMRRQEGARMCEDIKARLDVLAGMLAQVEADSAGRVSRYAQRLGERLRQLLEDAAVDEARLITEAAIFADKTAVDEETVRLASHLQQFNSILAEPGAVGRKLDFLTQEVNREVNTIGSKCQELEITRLVVDMKAEIEKIREQIQNLE